MDSLEILLRLSVATLAGLVLGLDRELRGIAAGIRTHALVALSSALITVSAFMVHVQLQDAGGSNVDPLRVVQGLAQAVGFVAAGTIFFAKGTVHNLTSAANVWLAAAIGIAAGSGQYILVLAGMGFGVLILTVVRVFESMVPGSAKGAKIPDSRAAENNHVRRSGYARKRRRRLLRQTEDKQSTPVNRR